MPLKFKTNYDLNNELFSNRINNKEETNYFSTETLKQTKNNLIRNNYKVIIACQKAHVKDNITLFLSHQSYQAIRIVL